MRKLAEVFRLELRSLVRSRAVAMLTIASVAWMLALPGIVRGDGTVEGARELCIRFSLGGVFALLVVSLLASSAGSLAREREANRLQLTAIRPVRHFAIALGAIFAHVAVGAAVLAVACVVLAFRTDLSAPCSHVLRPVMPSVQEEAKAMYAAYMADTNTPAAVRQAKKSVVLRLLANRAIDRYDTIGTNETARWKFRLDGVDGLDGLAVRMRFTNQFEMRQEVRGDFALGPLHASVSNITQAVLTVPLGRSAAGRGETPGELTFANRGTSAVMLRPRRDVELLAPADSFWRNLVRAYLEMVGVLSLIVAFGTALSAGLGRPVALFVAFVALTVSEMSPSVVEQYPDELETSAVDRIGLVITRFAADITRPVSSLSPLGKLSRDECVEPGEVAWILAADLCVLPLLLSLLAGLAVSRKHDAG